MSLGEVFGWLAVIAAGLGGIAYLARILIRLVKAWEAISIVVNRELSHNHGTSIKDDVHGTAISVNQLHADVVELQVTLASLAEANHLIWPAIEAVARAQPPEES